MARVNVEQKALSDARFTILGSHLKPLTRASQESVETAFGIFQMIRVWNYCMERGLLEVPGRDLDALYPGLCAAMLDAQLCEKVPRSRTGSVRIKGGEGRLDWLEQARNTGRENGVKGAQYGVLGGRPPKNKKPPAGVTGNGVGGLLENPPPTPTPTPTPALTEEQNQIPKHPASPVAAESANGSHPKKPRKEPTGVAAEFIRIFEDAWFLKYEAKYPFVGGKDGDAVKWFREQVADDISRFREVVRCYFEDCSQFIVDARHSMGNLRAQWARWAVKAPAGTRGGNVMDSFRATAEEFLRRGENVAS